MSEYTSLGIYNEGESYVMQGSIAKPKNAGVLGVFKTLQISINDTLWLHGRPNDRISVDGAIGPATRNAALNAGKYIGGNTYLDIFMQTPSEKTLARYAGEISQAFMLANKGFNKAPWSGGAKAPSSVGASASTIAPPGGFPEETILGIPVSQAGMIGGVGLLAWFWMGKPKRGKGRKRAGRRRRRR